MTNKEKYNKVFIETFSIDESALNDDLSYNTIPSWDSVGHMTLIAGFEDIVGINMETDDIMDFSSYNKGIELLTKYGIEL